MADYTITSLASTVVDLSLFYICNKELEKTKILYVTFTATILSRIVSTIVGYILNSRYVFKSNNSKKEQIIKHFILNGIQMLFSALILTFVHMTFNSNKIIEKCFVDGVLFFVFYYAQKYWVYK